MNEFKLSPKAKRFLLAAAPYWIGAVALTAIVLGTLDVLTPAKQYSYVWIYGFPIAQGIPSILLICIGIAWVFHGFGFIIIKG